MAVISTDISLSSASADIAREHPDILISPDSVSRLPSPTGSEFDSETKLVQDVGSRLHEYETTNKQLHAELRFAEDEKQELVLALRDLHRQVHSLQQQGDRQRERMESEGEELSACRQRIALLQKELAGVRGEYERTAKQQRSDDALTHTGKYDYVVACYRDALRELQVKLTRQQGAFVAQKKVHVDLLRKMKSLEERAEEFEGQHVGCVEAEADLRKSLADREKQIARLNKYIIRLKRELEILNGDLLKQNRDPISSESEHESAGNDFVAAAIAQQKRNDIPISGDRKEKASSGLPQDPPKKLMNEQCDDRKLPQQFVVIPVCDKAEGIHFPLNKKIMTVGRSPENDIPIRNKSISRFHARIMLGGSGVTVEDLGSTNGLRINSEHKKRFELSHGDTFKIGRVEFELIDLAIRADGLQTGNSV